MKDPEGLRSDLYTFLSVLQNDSPDQGDGARKGSPRHFDAVVVGNLALCLFPRAHKPLSGFAMENEVEEARAIFLSLGTPLFFGLSPYCLMHFVARKCQSVRLVGGTNCSRDRGRAAFGNTAKVY